MNTVVKPVAKPEKDAEADAKTPKYLAPEEVSMLDLIKASKKIDENVQKEEAAKTLAALKAKAGI
jgi:hypothetical protein